MTAGRVATQGEQVQPTVRLVVALCAVSVLGFTVAALSFLGKLAVAFDLGGGDGR